MPSVVSMPPNRSTAAFEAISSGVTPAACSAASRRSDGGAVAAAAAVISAASACDGARAAGGGSMPRLMPLTAATISAIPAEHEAARDRLEPERDEHDPRREGRREVEAQVTAAGARDRVDEPRRSPTRPPPVSRSRVASRRNGRAKGPRWRACSAPSRESMLGPTTWPVEKRGIVDRERRVDRA